jgi:hypothetical protein
VSSSNQRSEAWLTLRVFLPFVAGYDRVAVGRALFA